MSARVSDLHYVGLAVPDIAAERAFFAQTWGLVEVSEQDGKIYFAAEGSPYPFVIRLRQDDEKKTDLIGFAADSPQHRKVSPPGGYGGLWDEHWQPKPVVELLASAL